MNKILAILVILAVVIIAAVFILAQIGSREPSSETGPVAGGEESTTYPHNLLEGVIIDLDYANPTSFVMEADISKIEGQAGEGKAMKIIKLTPETKIVVYSLVAQVEVAVTVAELSVGDSVVVVTRESTEGGISTMEEFTANKVSKIVNPVPVQPTP